MDKNKLAYQLPIIAGIVLFFLILNSVVYFVITTKFINNRSDELKAKSIELSSYLPFDEDSLAVKVNTSFCLEGDLPRVDGAAALYPVFSSFVGSIYPENSVVFDGSDFTSESFLWMNNTRSSYEEIVDGTCDIIFCAYPSDEQLNYASENGVELVFVPIGKEAFVFFVNENNPVTNLTCDEVRDIYAGDITNWSQVGGDDFPIAAISRNKGSGSQTALESFMNGREIAPNMNLIFGRGIAFSFRFYVESITNYGGIRLLSLDGVYPTRESIANGTYPCTSYFYAVYRSDNDNPNIPVFIDWILSSEGQEVVEANGYVSVI